MTQENTIEKIIKNLSDLEGELDEAIRKLNEGKQQLDEGKDQPDEGIHEPDEGKNLSTKDTVNKNGQTSGTPVVVKRPWWARFREKIFKIGKEKKETSSNVSDNGGSQGGSSEKHFKDYVDAVLEIQKLQSDIRQMKAAFKNLTKFESTMSNSLEHDVPSNKLGAILRKTKSISSSFHDLKEIRRKILNLKCQIPSLLYKQSSTGGLSITDPQTAEENGQINEEGSDIYLPGLKFSGDFLDSSAFEEVVEKIHGLEFTEQLCLLSFAVFPENKEVERTMLMYWWIGEGFINCDHPENAVTGILDELWTKGLLEQVENERKLKPSSYKMEPHVHSAVIYITEFMDLFKLYNPKGKLTMQRSKKEKVCLVKGSSLEKAAKKTEMKPKSLKSVFNSSERYPDFTFKWFQEMDSLKVLYLGRWERTATRHIEVESTEFLKYMKALKNLKLASFQGISRIEKLHKSICDLGQLVILDLKACYNLESLPDDIGSLDNLIYLDVSECYMLDRMPEGIEDLVRLQVLKGFVISESDDERNCAVKHLRELRKLSITVNRNRFTVENLMESLKDLKNLESLKIAWGARFSEKEKGGEDNKGNIEPKENQRVPATEEKHKDLKEQEGDNKGQTSEEKQGDDKGMGKQEVEQKDGVSSRKKNGDGDEDGDGRNEMANIDEGKKQEERLKSDEVIKGENKASPSRESRETIQKKVDDQKGKGKVEEEGDKENGDQEQGKKLGEVEAESSKSEKKASLPAEEKVQNKSDDQKGKNNVEEDGDKEKADLEEGKKQEEVEAESSKSEKKASLPAEEKVQNKSDDQKGKNNVEEDGDKGKADLAEGKKQEEVEAEKSKSDGVVEGEKKANPSRESSDTIERKVDDQSKVEEKGHEEKGKADPVEGKKRDENGVEEGKNAGLSRESTNKPDDHQRGDKQEEKEDGKKEKANLEEGKKKNEVKAESKKPDKVTLQESKDGMQSRPDDHMNNSKEHINGDGVKDVADIKKLDGGEAKNQKSDKNKKLGKKVSFSEPPKAMIEKKPDERDTAMAKEKLSKGKGNETKRWRTWLGDTTIGTSKPPSSKLPPSLKKLELECFPDKDPPIWLYPKNLEYLEKLSIKGGSLRKISDELPTAENECQVKILRLKYLHEFKAKWEELRALFPNMTLLEKYKCPKVAFCPTDGNGVWKQPEHH